VNREQFDSIRLLETGHNSGVFNMAVDEVLMDSLAENPKKSKIPLASSRDNKASLIEQKSFETLQEEPFSIVPAAILRIYGWNPPAVSIGYFQSMELEVQIGECRRRGIDLVRRITGGGAVYHEAELTYSFLTNIFASDIMESYVTICNPVVEAIRKLGFDARFVPLNDIIIGNGVKVSGNAQTRRKNVLLQHGTILLDVNVEKMFSILKVVPEKMKDKLIDDVKKRVSGINKSFDEVARALKQSFSEAFESTLLADNLTSDERLRVNTLIREKYALDSWNLRR
jgi:lipoate-protein ligase A